MLIELKVRKKETTQQTEFRAKIANSCIIFETKCIPDSGLRRGLEYIFLLHNIHWQKHTPTWFLRGEIVCHILNIPNFNE